MKTITIAAAASLVFAGAAFASAPIQSNKAPAFKPAASASATTAATKVQLAAGGSNGTGGVRSFCSTFPKFCPIRHG